MAFAFLELPTSMFSVLVSLLRLRNDRIYLLIKEAKKL
jgi:hypothetical protein